MLSVNPQAKEKKRIYDRNYRRKEMEQKEEEEKLAAAKREKGRLRTQKCRAKQKQEKEEAKKKKQEEEEAKMADPEARDDQGPMPSSNGSNFHTPRRRRVPHDVGTPGRNSTARSGKTASTPVARTVNNLDRATMDAMSNETLSAIGSLLTDDIKHQQASSAKKDALDRRERGTFRRQRNADMDWFQREADSIQQKRIAEADLNLQERERVFEQNAAREERDQ